MPSQFPTTRWSLIARASRESPVGSREQMGELLAHYSRPMLIHLRYKGLSQEQAEDVLQDFMVELLDQDLLLVADPKKGKFRSLLLTALDRFLISRLRHQSAAKRSPGALASLDCAETDQTQASETGGGLVFERAWALDVLAEALARLEQESAAGNALPRWQVFEERVVQPLLNDAPESGYDELARRFGFEHGKAAMNLLVTAKRQFARVLRDVIREYVTRSANEGRSAEHSTVDGLDLYEHQIRQAVERELIDLQHVLAKSRAVADAVVDLREDDKAANPAKSRYWRLLTARTSEADLWSELFSTGSETTDESLSAGCEQVLEMPLRQAPGCAELADVTIGDVLRSRHPSLGALLALKSWFNLQRFSPARDVTAPLANGLYLVVLAVALVRCSERITGLADPQFRASLEWLARQPWLPDDLHAMAVAAGDSLAGSSRTSRDDRE